MNLFLAKTFLVLLHLSITVSFAQTPTIQPPSQAPAKASPFPRSLVAVEGEVWCKSCQHLNSDTLLDATPIPGAIVKFECNNTRKTFFIEATTNKNGYFLIGGPKGITTYAAHKCKVFLLSSPIATCNKPTNFHDGQVGALLKPMNPHGTQPLQSNKLCTVKAVELFTVGQLAYEPSKCP